ncbi:hypothetical protein RCL1_003509 [Eukaryota sp. TZLM3-RCL]
MSAFDITNPVSVSLFTDQTLLHSVEVTLNRTKSKDLSSIVTLDCIHYIASLSGVGQLLHLESLDFSVDSDLGPCDLSPLLSLPCLKNLTIRRWSNPAYPPDFSVLSSLTNLKQFSFANNFSEKWLHNLFKLEKLVFFNAIDLSHFYGIPSLQETVFHSDFCNPFILTLLSSLRIVRISADSLHNLPQLSQINLLEVFGAASSVISMDSLVHFHSLNNLILRRCLEYTCTLTMNHIVNLSFTYNDANQLNILKYFPSLKSLSINCAQNVVDLSYIICPFKIKKLKLFVVGVVDLSVLSGFTELEEFSFLRLKLFKQCITPFDCSLLQLLPKLSLLSLVGVELENAGRIPFASLKELSLRSCSNIGGICVGQNNPLLNLEVLDLSRTDITNFDQIFPLNLLSNLCVLKLSFCSHLEPFTISSESFENLKVLHVQKSTIVINSPLLVTELELSRPSITDLSLLFEFPKLEVLKIHGLTREEQDIFERGPYSNWFCDVTFYK